MASLVIFLDFTDFTEMLKSGNREIKTIILLNLAEYRLILAYSAYGLVG